ncbi:hypothetical protein EKTHUN627_12490 [Enterobacter kobei]|nr:hypothetical protein EKTHUN627_12490 [Enterobacter kobei]GJA04047.1 hypothetical protein ECV0102_43950 [Enterobacter cloacae]
MSLFGIFLQPLQPMLQIFKNIPYLGYRRCALLYQPVWPFAAGVTYRTGQGENLPPLLKCAPGRDQRAASHCRFNDQDALA